MHEMTRKLCWLKLGLLALGVPIISVAPLAAGATVTVEGRDNNFFPATTNINVNDTVKWNWNANDVNVHSSTSDSAVWGSSVMGAGTTFSFQFTTSGSFPYRCTVHSSVQLGAITVAAGITPPAFSITSPASGSVFSAPGGFTISVTA